MTLYISIMYCKLIFLESAGHFQLILRCQPTPPCLFGGVLPYFEVTGHPVPLSSLGFKRLDYFTLNYSYVVLERAIQGQLPKVFRAMIIIPDGGLCGRRS